MILTSARTLVGQRGSDAVSMREIALHAGVPISSLYQYFDDKNAILRQLMLKYLEQLYARFGAILDGLHSPEDIADGLDTMVDILVELFEQEQELPMIWSAVQASPELRQQDADDGRRVAEFLCARFLQIVPEADAEGVFRACLYAAHTANHTVHVAMADAGSEDGKRLLDELKTLLRLRLQTLLPAATS